MENYKNLYYNNIQYSSELQYNMNLIFRKADPVFRPSPFKPLEMHLNPIFSHKSNPIFRKNPVLNDAKSQKFIKWWEMNSASEDAEDETENDPNAPVRLSPEEWRTLRQSRVKTDAMRAKTEARTASLLTGDTAEPADESSMTSDQRWEAERKAKEGKTDSGETPYETRPTIKTEPEAYSIPDPTASIPKTSSAASSSAASSTAKPASHSTETPKSPKPSAPPKTPPETGAGAGAGSATNTPPKPDEESEESEESEEVKETEAQRKIRELQEKMQKGIQKMTQHDSEIEEGLKKEIDHEFSSIENVPVPLDPLVKGMTVYLQDKYKALMIDTAKPLSEQPAYYLILPDDTELLKNFKVNLGTTLITAKTAVKNQKLGTLDKTAGKWDPSHSYMVIRMPSKSSSALKKQIIKGVQDRISTFYSSRHADPAAKVAVEVKGDPPETPAELFKRTAKNVAEAVFSPLRKSINIFSPTRATSTVSPYKTVMNVSPSTPAKK